MLLLQRPLAPRITCTTCIVHLNGYIQDGIRLKVQSRTRYQIQLHAGYLEQRGVVTTQTQIVRAQSIVGYNNIGDLGTGSGVSILAQRQYCVGQSNRRRLVDIGDGD